MVREYKYIRGVPKMLKCEAFLHQAPQRIVAVGDGALERVDALDRLAGGIVAVFGGAFQGVGCPEDAPHFVVGIAGVAAPVGSTTLVGSWLAS